MQCHEGHAREVSRCCRAHRLFKEDYEVTHGREHLGRHVVQSLRGPPACLPAHVAVAMLDGRRARALALPSSQPVSAQIEAVDVGHTLGHSCPSVSEGAWEAGG